MTDHETLTPIPTTVALGAAVQGYRPLRLTLIGFKGIKSGLCCDRLTLDLETLAGDAALVAIAGANGRGKTTVLENLQPHMVQPSRAGADGLGAFSYYDHVFLPESQKELVWSLAGRRFKSHLVFRLNGKRKTEAYLFEQHVDSSPDAGSNGDMEGGINPQRWQPFVLRDGTRCDGKVDRYERALVELLGSPETFFTSVFCAQGKRPLALYKNAEIKALLADLLGLDEVRAQGAKALETARLLKTGLSALRQTLATVDAQCQALAASASQGPATETVLRQAQERQAQAHQALETRRDRLTQTQGQQQAAQGTQKRREELLAERLTIQQQDVRAQARIEQQAQDLRMRWQALAQRVAARQAQHGERRAALLRQLASLEALRAHEGKVRWALRRGALAEQVLQARGGRLGLVQASVEQETQLKQAAQTLRQNIGSFEREAGQVALRQLDLARRLQLCQQVPCAGSDLQGRCQLLSNAHEAQSLKPNVDAQLEVLAARKQDAMEQVRKVEQQQVAEHRLARQLPQAQWHWDRAQSRCEAMAHWAGRAPELERAQQAWQDAQAELQAWGLNAPVSTPQEDQERQAWTQASLRLRADTLEARSQRQQGLARMDAALAALPAPLDRQEWVQAQSLFAQAQQQVQRSQQQVMEALRRSEQCKAATHQREQLAAQSERQQAQIIGVEQELSQWNLLAKALSHDGVIALEIDDAGPTLARYANDLLLACYGPRFTVQICTQVETAKGEWREGIDIVVHDGQSGESKSVSLLSFGERTWIEQALTRAIALHLACKTGRLYGTLFCDEADGALDPEHKRMFMAMKREVLRLGSYQCEYFVSQTPSLAACADAVIDLDAFAAPPERAS